MYVHEIGENLCDSISFFFSIVVLMGFCLLTESEHVFLFL